MDLSHIYGGNLERQHKLRLFKDGKLQYQVWEETAEALTDTRFKPHECPNSCFLSFVTLQIMNGEVYPPTVKEVGADMHYPPHVPESHRFAVGHEAFGLVPGLMMYATLWLREHNRVCDVLKEVHPDWDDERLFQTTRLILIGEFKSISCDFFRKRLHRNRGNKTETIVRW